MPRISMVIPAFNEEQHLPLLLDSIELARQRYPLEIRSVASAVLGLYLLVRGLGDLAGVAATMLTLPKWDETGAFNYIWQRERQLAITGVVDTIAGVILLVNRQKVAAVLSKTWRAVRSTDGSSEPRDE